MSRPEHWPTMMKLFVARYDHNIIDEHPEFAIEYLCNELSITDEALRMTTEAVRLLEARVKALDGAKKSEISDKAMSLADKINRTSAMTEPGNAIHIGVASQHIQAALAAERNRALDDAISLLSTHRIVTVGGALRIVQSDEYHADRLWIERIRTLKTPEQV